ncbi:MAG: hypothetical protein R3C58_15330 [Parvularculaceae bacterium]
MSETVLLTRDGPVLTVAINRPERRNAVDSATAAALYNAFQDLTPTHLCRSRC